MIAKNYTRHPEALRFQHELFSSGYHNSPRIMRLMECIFDWTPAAPAWWTAAKARARTLAKAVKKSIADFFKEMTVKAADQLSLVFDAPATVNTVTATLQAQIVTARNNPILQPYWGAGSNCWQLQASRAYRWFCPTQRHAMYRGGFEYAAAEA